MKVFEITHSPKPKVGRFRNFAGLSLNERDFYVFGNVGKGRPFSGDWKPISMYVENPSSPWPDIFGFPGGFVCSNTIFNLLAEPLERCAESLPVFIESESEKYNLCHIMTSFNAVDKNKSTWRSFGGKKGVKMLDKPTFIGERLGEESLFKIPDDGYVGNYCLERLGDPEDGEFKALVEHHGLTGLEFNLVWSDEIENLQHP